MDGNKDDSDRCFNLAKRSLADGDEEKAIRLLLKAQRLYPSKKAEELLKKLTEEEKVTDEEKSESKTEWSEKESKEDVRKPRASGSGDAHAFQKSENKENKTKEYTTEQLTAVRRVLKCKDYYEVLEVGKECTENDLKKAYRKLALLMHPDKNKAPGATEAFKAIGNAYAVLNDPDKRKKYDVYGPELQQSSPRDSPAYTHGGFEGDITPEELFNMFFGGGFPSGNINRRHYSHGHNRTHYYTYSAGPNRDQASESSYTLLLQLAPILLLVLLSLMSSFFVSDPIYSLQRTQKYSVQRETYNLKVPYYVKEDFKIDGNFRGELRRIERSVEEEYISQLRSNCWRERTYKENMLWRAKNYGDARLYQQATEIKTPSCDKIQSLYT